MREHVEAKLSSTRLQKISKAMHAFGKGEYQTRIEIENADELSQLETDFNSMARSIEKTHEFKENFLVDATHQIKNPITSIKALSESLLSSTTQDVSVFKDFLQDINMEADKLSNITEKLLRLYAVDFEYNVIKEETRIRDLIIKTTKNIKTVGESKDIEIIYQIDDELTWSIRRASFYHMIINVIDNSIKYSPTNTKIWVKAFVRSNILLVQVEDQGIGIPDEHVSYVTDNFYRVQQDGFEDLTGSGLGLSLVRRLTEYHDGWLEIKSEVGVGTIVTMFLPDIKETI